MNEKTLYVATSHFVDQQLGGITRRQLLPDLSDAKAAQLLELKLIAPVIRPETTQVETQIEVLEPTEPVEPAGEPQPEPVTLAEPKSSKKKG